MGAAGTDVALETADVVLMSDALEGVPYTLALSRRTRRVVYQNLTFALAVIVVLVISALGLHYRCARRRRSRRQHGARLSQRPAPVGIQGLSGLSEKRGRGASCLPIERKRGCQSPAWPA